MLRLNYYTPKNVGAPRTIEKRKILGAVLELPAKQHCQSSPKPQNWAKLAKLAVLFSW